MNESSKLREMLMQFFVYVENQDIPNISDTMDKFREIFKDKYFSREENVNTAYYQQKSKSYYIKNSNGIVLSIFSGDGDRFARNVSHKGIDVSIASILSKDSEVSDGIFIFDEGKYCNPLLSSKVDNFLDLDISVEKLKKTDDEFIYKTLSEDISKSNDMVLYRYKQLKNKAELENRSLYSDYMVSPYGGLDIDVIPVDELLYEYLRDFKDDEYFMDRAMALFYCDFPNYFKKKIEECSHALHIIKHQKEYERLCNLQEEIYQSEWNSSVNISEISKTKSDVQIRISDLLDERKDLSSKKYNLFELMIGKKKNDKVRIDKLTQDIEHANLELANIEKDISDYMENSNYYNNLRNDYKILKHKLKKPFKNFSIKDDFFDLYINGEFGELVSLRKLAYMKDNYTNKLNELLENKEKAQKNYGYVKESLLSKDNIEDNDYEYKF